MSKTRRIIDLIALIVVVLIGLAVFIKIYMPGMRKSIQRAIEKAGPGDIVFVKAGIYEERIRLGNNIKLIGEGVDKVIIRCDARLGHVLLARGGSGLIKNLTIEQTGRDKVDPTAIPVGLYIWNSSVEVVNCRVSRTDGYGIVVQGKSSPLIRDCVSESSRLNGIYVDGRDAKPTIKNSKFQGNGQHGIFFRREAEGYVEGNICRGNRETGIYVSQPGTNVTLENNDCRENEAHGICFDLGAGGIAEGNLCERNGGQGILIESMGTRVSVSRNRCLMNKGNGILFRDGANGEVQENICSDNIQNGIRFANGAKALAENNICERNYLPGILVSGDDTSIILRNNQCDEDIKTNE